MSEHDTDILFGRLFCVKDGGEFISYALTRPWGAALVKEICQRVYRCDALWHNRAPRKWATGQESEEAL